MKISEVKIKLLANDILSIINEFIKIDGLNINKLSIEEGILIEGNFKKILNIDFHVRAEIVDCIDNKIILRLSEFKVLNIGMFKIFRSFALKQLVKMFADKGINSDKDKIIVHVNKLIKDIPFVDLNIEEIFIKKSEVWAEINNLNISIEGKLIKKVYEDELLEEQEEKSIEDLNNINKIEDNYSKGRKILENKISKQAKNYEDYIFILPDIISLIYRLLKDKRVPIRTKIAICGAIVYISMPIDIMPDSIPFIGNIDDIGVLFFVLNKILKDVPLSIIIENWQGKNEILIVLKKSIQYLTNFTAAKNVEKLYSIIAELST